MSVRTFMQCYRLGTEKNPLQTHERTWQGRAAFQVQPSSAQRGVIWLNGLRSFARGAGHGTQALRWLIRLARAHNVAIAGMCSPCGDRRPRLEYRQLKAWYVRNGFTVNGRGQMWLLPVQPKPKMCKAWPRCACILQGRQDIDCHFYSV